MFKPEVGQVVWIIDGESGKTLNTLPYWGEVRKSGPTAEVLVSGSVQHFHANQLFPTAFDALVKQMEMYAKGIKYAENEIRQTQEDSLGILEELEECGEDDEFDQLLDDLHENEEHLARVRADLEQAQKNLAQVEAAIQSQKSE